MVSVFYTPWFDSGYKFMRQNTVAGFAGGHASRAVLAEMRGGLFRALYTGTGPGAVSTGTRPP